MSLKSAIDQLLQSAVDRGEVPGVAAAVTSRDGTLYEGAFGVRTLGQSAAMTTDTVVWIASMTKALTGAATMQLVEQGKLDLDVPAKKWVPLLADVHVLEGFDGSGQPKLRPPTGEVTLRQLLTHTAGFGYEIWNADIAKYQEVMGLPGITACANDSLKMPLLFDPGARWNYGINIDFAGKAVEAVSGQKLGAYMKASLFEPMGMADTAFKIRPDMRSRLAKIHHRGDDGALVAGDVEIPQEPEFEMGGGGLYGTVPDYLKFVRCILNHGKSESGRQVLKPETVDAMCRNQMGTSNVTLMKTVAPPLSNDAEFFPGLPKKWGLSWQINTEQAPTGRSAGGLQWAGLANTYYWIDPAKGIGGVYATQILPFADKKSLPLFEAFESAVYKNMA